MKVLYISYDGMTDNLGQSQVIPYLAGLSERGYDISIISCEKKEKYKKDSENISALLAGYNIDWHPVMYSTRPSFFSKQINLFRIKKKAYELVEKNKPSIVHCRSYMAALIGMNFKKRFGIKFVFDMRGFWADERVDGKIWDLKRTLHKRIYNYFKKKEKEFLRNADYTVSLTENAKSEILSWPETDKDIPIEVIPCCVDLNLFSTNAIESDKQEELKNQLGIVPSDFILSYLGSIGTWYMLDEMLDFFKILIQNKKEAKFLFITSDNKDIIVERSINKGIAEGKIIVVNAARTQVPLYLSISQLSVYFIKPLYSKKASSPTKTGEIMAMGIPIITNKGIGDSDKLIAETGTGLIVRDFSKNEFERIIREIDVLLRVDKKVIETTAEEFYSLKKGIDKYERIYKSLIK